MDKKLKVYVTAKDTNERLCYKGEKEFVPDQNGEEGRIINLYDEVKYQELTGFGGAVTEAVVSTIDKLPTALRKEILTAYFDKNDGIGYSLCRTHINSCDFSIENYDYVQKDDKSLKSFDMSRDMKSIVPFIQEAKRTAGHDFQLFASPWSPPAWMKDNQKMNNGGKLLPEFRETWARYYAKYIHCMKEQGLDIFAVTVQNEPKATQTWDSCVYTPEEERDFVKEYLGPVLAEEGLADVGIIVWDHNKERLFDWSHVSLSDKEANQYIWGAGFHWYSGDHFEAIEALHTLYPSKKWLFTEGCQEGGVQLGSWATGERYGHDIIGNLNNWCNGFTDWNIVLDEQGGPNHVSNFCDAPIIADTKEKKLIYESSFYYIGHFSKFIRPGAKRIACTKYTPQIETTAFANTDGSLVLVVMNGQEKDIEFKVRYKGELALMQIASHAIMTIIIQ